MADGATFISAIVGFGIVIVAGAMLGAGSHTVLTGLFATQGARDWPTGVQEEDAPHFDFSHRSDPTADASIAGRAIADDPAWARIEDLYEGPLR